MSSLPIAHGEAIDESNLEVWLQLRQPGPRGFPPILGTSQLAQAVGLSPFGTPLELFNQLRGRSEAFTGNRATRKGKALQRWALGEYEMETGERVAREEVFYHGPDYHDVQLTTTVDALTHSGKGVEVKTTNWRQAEYWGESGTNQVPAHVAVQVLGQQLCGEIGTSDVVASIGDDDFRIFHLDHHRAAVDGLLDGFERFAWHLANDVPPVVSQPDDLGELCKAFPWTAPPRRLPVEAIPLADALVMAQAQAKEFTREGLEVEARVKYLKAQLAELLKGSPFGELPDGRTVSCKKTVIKPRTQEVKGYEYLTVKVKEMAK